MLNKLASILSKPKSTSLIPQIEGLRFIAIAGVVISHINLHLLRVSGLPEEFVLSNSLAIVLEQGGAGVNIFFFISGFVLALPFLKALETKQKVSLKHYYLRRLIRIEPPYIISLLILFVPALFVFQQEFSEAIQHLLASIFYVHNIIYNQQSTINPVAWTLEIEIQFYLLLPLFAFLLFKKNVVVRRCLLLASFLLLSQLYASNAEWFAQHHLSKSFFAYAANFFTGMIAAEIYLTYKDFLTKESGNWLWDVLGIASLISIFHFSGYQAFEVRMLIFFSYIILFTSLFKGRLLKNMFTTKWIVIIGGMCYSIYLIHYPIIYAAEELAVKHLLTNSYYTNAAIHTVLLLPVVFIASAAFFVWIEKPFLVKGKQYKRL